MERAQGGAQLARARGGMRFVVTLDLGPSRKIQAQTDDVFDDAEKAHKMGLHKQQSLLCFALVVSASAFRPATAGRRVPARTRMTADDEELWWEPEELDVVEYQLDASDEALGVGVVMKCGGIHPLCVYQEGGTHFVWDEELDVVAGDLAVRVIDGAILSTRQAKRGVDNPHGEHAEDVFVIDEGLLDPRVEIVVRLDRET